MRLRFSRSICASAAIFAVGLLAVSPASAKTFAASPGTLGAIPDGLSGNCSSPTPGAPRIVTFAVKGLKDTITSVQAKMTFGTAHPWAGDITVVLIAPNSASQTLFARTGSLTTLFCGDSSDLAGPYTFSDSATLSWWTAAAATSAPIPSGVYRSSGLGGPAVASAPGNTLITPAFAGVNPNGTWFLAVNDSINGDTGSVTAASVTITAKDTIDPNTTIVKKPKKMTSDTKATFRFRSSEAGQKFKCRLGSRPWKACTKTTTYTVGRGKHTLRVRAIDQAGNRDETPASYSWTVAG